MQNLIDALEEFFGFILWGLTQVSTFFTTTIIGQLLLACAVFPLVFGVLVSGLSKFTKK